MTTLQDIGIVAEAALTVSTEAWTQRSFPALKPFSVLVSFRGELPPNLRDENIPIKLTVSLPPEYAAYTTPVLRKTPTEFFNWASDVGSLTSDENNFDGYNQSGFPVELQGIPIPFLPLEKSFDHRDVRSWSRLAEVISSW
ncbi:hypothetical protein AX14_011837 [Amanita brunnescens Koide BX004]|nr:hypothetical protein AX14_011837 [Amanita brunnescens Koide BX004]